MSFQDMRLAASDLNKLLITQPTSVPENRKISVNDLIVNHL